MQSDATTVEAYLSELEPDRKQSVSAVRDVILENLPDGYEEVMQYGMISYVVPISVLADTYNGQPLMYAALASQKRHISLYLTNVYGDEGSAEWFRKRYAESGKKLNMGKSCVRFRKGRRPASGRGRRSHRPNADGRVPRNLSRIEGRPPQIAVRAPDSPGCARAPTPRRQDACTASRGHERSQPGCCKRWKFTATVT